MPIGIIGSLVICTVLYIAGVAALTGMVPLRQDQRRRPGLRTRSSRCSAPWLRPLITLGAVTGLGSVLLVMMLGQPRVFYSMARDGLVGPGPARFTRGSAPRTCRRSTSASSSRSSPALPDPDPGRAGQHRHAAGLRARLRGVWIMRKTHPDLDRPFRTPLVPLVPILGILTCLGPDGHAPRGHLAPAVRLARSSGS